MKILYQGNEGAYSQLAAKEIFPDAELISCKTFEECFKKSSNDESLRTIIPIENSIAGRVADIQYLMNKYKLQIYAEHFHKVSHNLMARQGVLIDNLKYVRSHSQAISQCQKLINDYKLEPIIAADTAGSAKYISENNNNTEAAIASELSSKIYNLDIIESNIENEKGNVTRFLVMGKTVYQPELKKGKYITSLLFKLKSKPAALYSALSGFAIQGVNLTKLQSYPEKNSFSSYFFLCDLDGHIESPKVKKSLEELGLHCDDMHILGVYESDKFRDK